MFQLRVMVTISRDPSKHQPAEVLQPPPTPNQREGTLFQLFGVYRMGFRGLRKEILN